VSADLRVDLWTDAADVNFADLYFAAIRRQVAGGADEIDGRDGCDTDIKTTD